MHQVDYDSLLAPPDAEGDSTGYDPTPLSGFDPTWKGGPVPVGLKPVEEPYSLRGQELYSEEPCSSHIRLFLPLLSGTGAYSKGCRCWIKKDAGVGVP